MILELLRSRSSIRSFETRRIPEAILDDILEAGRLSPSGGNEQPWLFGVITNGELITSIAELARGQLWIAGAPAIIALCTRHVGDDRGGRGTQKLRFPDYADEIDSLPLGLFHALTQEEHQTKIAGAHMALVALEHGIGSCWVSHFDVASVSRLLRLPPGCTASELLVLGYPSGDRTMQPKRQKADVVFRNTVS